MGPRGKFFVEVVFITLPLGMAILVKMLSLRDLDLKAGELFVAIFALLSSTFIEFAYKYFEVKSKKGESVEEILTALFTGDIARYWQQVGFAALFFIGAILFALGAGYSSVHENAFNIWLAILYHVGVVLGSVWVRWRYLWR